MGFRQAAAGLPRCRPHDLRLTPGRLGGTRCRSIEAFEAWSRNLGHEGVMTTFTSYGTVRPERQAEIIGGLSVGERKDDPFDRLAERVLAKMNEQNRSAPA